MRMKMFDGRWNKKRVYYKLSRYPRKDNGFYKTRPRVNSTEYAEITPFANVDSHKELWVKLRWSDKYVIYSSEDIIELADVLKKLKKLPKKMWKNE